MRKPPRKRKPPSRRPTSLAKPPARPQAPPTDRVSLLNSLPVPVALLDRRGIVVAVNQAWERLACEISHPFLQGAEVGTDYLEACRRSLKGPADHEREALEGIRAVMNGLLPSYRLDYVWQARAATRWFLLSAVPETGTGGVLLSHTERTEQKLTERAHKKAAEEAARAQARLDTLYATIPIGLLYVTPDLVVEHASPLIAELHGCPVAEQIGRRLPDLVPPERWARLKPIYNQVGRTGVPVYEFEEELPDPKTPGGTRFLLSEYYPDRGEDGTIRGVQSVVQDVTVLKRAQRAQEQQLKELEAKNQELDQLAIRDPLTGQYNRRFFDEVLAREWRRFQRTGEAFTVIIMDLDAFKGINDEYGHEAGDRALQKVATALRSTLRESDLVARIGGDEFAALLPGTDTEGSGPVIEKLREVVGKLRLVTAAGPVTISLSFGAATVPGFPPVTSAADLLRVADKRMYDMKRLHSAGQADLH
ncbi:MAG: diguanylate cyclase [Nitrospirota bacterium]